MTRDEALEYTVHSFRHTFVVASVQLRHRGVLVPEAVERVLIGRAY